MVRENHAAHDRDPGGTIPGCACALCVGIRERQSREREAARESDRLERERRAAQGGPVAPGFYAPTCECCECAEYRTAAEQWDREREAEPVRAERRVPDSAFSVLMEGWNAGPPIRPTWISTENTANTGDNS
jgi:hypothetical protein